MKNLLILTLALFTISCCKEEELLFDPTGKYEMLNDVTSCSKFSYGHEPHALHPSVSKTFEILKIDNHWYFRGSDFNNTTHDYLLERYTHNATNFVGHFKGGDHQFYEITVSFGPAIAGADTETIFYSINLEYREDGTWHIYNSNVKPIN